MTLIEIHSIGVIFLLPNSVYSKKNKITPNQNIKYFENTHFNI